MEPEIEEFRRRLAMIAGEERYRGFLWSLNHMNRWSGRFHFWRERLLAEAGVVAESPGELFELVEPWLRFCPHHDVELQADPERWAGRCRGGMKESGVPWGEFPYTDCGPVHHGDRFDNIRKGVWYCTACGEAEAAWMERSGMADWLRQRREEVE